MSSDEQHPPDNSSPQEPGVPQGSDDPRQEPSLEPAAEPIASSEGAADKATDETAETAAPPQQPSAPLQSSEAPTSPTLIEPPRKPHWRNQLSALGARIRDSRWARELGMKIQNFEPAQAAEWASRTFQRQDAGAYGKAATIGLCAFFLADLLALLAGQYIPEPPVSRVSRTSTYQRHKTLEDYSVVFTRNLFNSQGIIPGEETATPGGPIDQGGPPVRTTLPLNLIGTVILQDEMRSIATIEDKSASTVYPVRQLDEIPSKAKIVKIEPRKVIFINTASGRREFVDLPDDGTPPVVANPRTSASGPRGAGIEKIAPNQFNVQRTEVDSALKDLNKVLTEARAVPNFENGVPNGYKLFQIVPGSIYDKLGLQNGDVITGLNGAVINDPGKAFEMLSELKTSNHLELQVKKNGRVQNYIYDIR